MNYSVKELRDSLGDKILGLGVTSTFKENPSFGVALIEVDMLLAQMNMFQVADKITVREDERGISFSWDSNYDVRYDFSLVARGERAFTCIVTEERKPTLNKEGNLERIKRVVEKVAVLKEDGEVVLTTNGSMVSGIENEDFSHNKAWCDRKVYDAKGVMREREFRTYPENILGEIIDNLKTDSILYVPRQAFIHGFMSDRYDSRNLMVRNKIDTAKVLVEDRANNKKFMGEVELNLQYGLRNLTLDRDFAYPREVLIKPKTADEIDSMIKSVHNPVIEEGLREYAKGRENYYYSSVEDKTFMCECGLDSTKVLK